MPLRSTTRVHSARKASAPAPSAESTAPPGGIGASCAPSFRARTSTRAVCPRRNSPAGSTTRTTRSTPGAGGPGGRAEGRRVEHDLAGRPVDVDAVEGQLLEVGGHQPAGPGEGLVGQRPSPVSESWWWVLLGERSSSPSVTKAPRGWLVPTPAKSALMPRRQWTRAHIRLVVSSRARRPATVSFDSTARSDTGRPGGDPGDVHHHRRIGPGEDDVLDSLGRPVLGCHGEAGGDRQVGRPSRPPGWRVSARRRRAPHRGRRAGDVEAVGGASLKSSASRARSPLFGDACQAHVSG